jgi:hypothetical protein
MSTRLILILSGVGIFAILGVLLVTVVKPFNSNNTQPVTIICQTGIQAGLTQGPDSPLDLSGDLKLIVTSDATFSGVLTLKKDGSQVNVKGAGTGRGIDLVFDMGNGKLLFAHGSQENPIYDCQGYVGGPLTGPCYGDTGDWTNYPPFIRVISGTRNV